MNEKEDKFFVNETGRVYVSTLDRRGKPYNILCMYSYDESMRKIDAVAMANRIAALLNAYGDVPSAALRAQRMEAPDTDTLRTFAELACTYPNEAVENLWDMAIAAAALAADEAEGE